LGIDAQGSHLEITNPFLGICAVSEKSELWQLATLNESAALYQRNDES
jgi:hypothetical protein